MHSGRFMLAALLGLTVTQAHAANSTPVVLELFTSQGCSSCPPADALMKRLAAEDHDLLPLSFHVHYWTIWAGKTRFHPAFIPTGKGNMRIP